MDGAASFNRFHSSASANQYSDSECSISLFASSATSRHMSSNTANSSFEYMGRPHSIKSIPRYKGGQTYNSVMQLDTCVKAFPNMSKIKLRRWSRICNTNEPHAFRCKRSRSSYRNPQMPLITARSICSGTRGVRRNVYGLIARVIGKSYRRRGRLRVGIGCPRASTRTPALRRVSPVQHVLDRHCVPLASARRCHASRVECLRNLAQRGRPCPLCFLDDRKNVRRVLVCAGLD